MHGRCASGGLLRGVSPGQQGCGADNTAPHPNQEKLALMWLILMGKCGRIQ